MLKKCLIAGIVIYGLVSIAVMSAAIFGQECYSGVCLVPSKAAVAAKDEIKAVPQKVESDCPAYKWEQASDDQYWLRKDGNIVGQWHTPTCAYYPWDGKTNGKAQHPPIDPPSKGYQGVLSDDVKKWCQNGIMHGKRNNDEHLSFGGRKIEANQLQSAMSGKLTDDSGKGWFIAIAKDSQTRAKLVAEWNKLPEDFKAKYAVWDLPPDHFSMHDRFSGKPRFHTDSDPTIVLQDSNGAVLFRRPRPGFKYVSSDFQDLLKADPNYNPALDPGAAKTPGFDFSSVPPIGWAAGGVALLALFALRRK